MYYYYYLVTNVLLLIRSTLERILSTTTLNIFPYGRVLLRLNAFGHQCTTAKCVWYYYNWVYIGENSEYYYFKRQVLLHTQTARPSTNSNLHRRTATPRYYYIDVRQHPGTATSTYGNRYALKRRNCSRCTTTLNIIYVGLVITAFAYYKSRVVHTRRGTPKY